MATAGPAPGSLRTLHLSAIKDQIHDGDALLFSGHTVGDLLVRWRTRSKYTHIAVCLWVRIGSEARLCVFQATPKAGVHLAELSPYLKDREKHGVAVEWFRLLKANGDQRSRMVDWCLTVWGQRYSPWWQFAVSFDFGPLRWLWRRLGLKPEVDPSRPFCSWVYSGAAKYAGFTLPGEDEPAKITPAMVAEYPFLERMGRLLR